MRKLLFLLLLLPLTLGAESIGQWRVYPSYWTATRHVAAGKAFYVLTGQNLMRYDTDDESVRTYNALDDLHDVGIEYIDYSKEAHRLIIVYDNGNIDLLDDDDNLTNISSLKDKVMNGKHVSSLYVCGSNAYLTTDFGFVEVDMREGVIRKTYQLGRALTAMLIQDGKYILARADGIYSIPLDGNLYDPAAYRKLSSTVGVQKLFAIGSKTFMCPKYHVYEIGKGTPLLNGKFKFFDPQADGSFLTGNDTIVYHLRADLSVSAYHIRQDFHSATLQGTTLWASNGESGLQRYTASETTLTPTETRIQPNSPVHDYFYRMHYEGDRLLVAGGIASYFGDDHAPTAMLYEGDEWTNLDESYLTAHPEKNINNITDLTQDPRDPTHLFAGTFRRGLLEFKDGRFKKLYNCDNSPIASILPDNAKYYMYCGTMGAKYDSEGRLWMLNNETDTIVRLIDTDGRWRALYYPEIAATQTPTDYLFTSSGVNFIVSRRMTGRGFFAFHTGGTLTTTRDDHHILRTTITNEDNTSYTPDEFYCLTEDLTGQVWCGTNLGLFVITDPLTYFDTDFHFEQIKIARGDGSGLADYLLSGVSISSIAVDGANRKWIGTNANGLYLISADGQEMIHHFLAEDSPLLSNNVESIAIHPSTGRVMIGTDRGLCSFMADATEAEPTLDYDNVKVYPNPVRPDYQGPITIDGLAQNSEVKICSAAGSLVFSTRSNGGRATWNGHDHQGRRVASGVYQVIATTETASNAVVARIVVIR